MRVALERERGNQYKPRRSPCLRIEGKKKGTQYRLPGPRAISLISREGGTSCNRGRSSCLASFSRRKAGVICLNSGTGREEDLRSLEASKKKERKKRRGK